MATVTVKCVLLPAARLTTGDDKIVFQVCPMAVRSKLSATLPVLVMRRVYVMV
jgi:hypothetical protein